jgi:hypothetical protein
MIKSPFVKLTGERRAGTVPVFLCLIRTRTARFCSHLQEKNSGQGKNYMAADAVLRPFAGQRRRHANCHSTRRVAGLIKNTAGP